MIDKATNFIGKGYRETAQKFMTVLKESKFYEEGVLTPEEYIKAGDFLTSKCPTWKWCSNKEGIKPADYLPKNKQFLMTSVPCGNRVKQFEKNNQTTEKLVEDDWVEANTNFFNNNKKVIEIDQLEEETKQKKVELKFDDNYLDIETVKDTKEKPKDEDNDDFIVIEENDNKIIKTRMYDVTVTYDFYYRVPRMWLVGYSENGNPLLDSEVKEDIMSEYMDKTVTIETHPNLGTKCVSIHPCRHSLLLKKMISNFEQSGKKLEPHFSIVLFLKFLHSVVPTIQYDFTMDIDF